MKIKQLLAQAAHMLQASPSPEIDAEYLLCFVLGKKRGFLFSHNDQEITPELQNQFEALITERAKGKPIAYLIGSQGFWKHDFIVTEATLIPRPETELFIETTLSLLDTSKPARILDLGTGSGAIALSLALESPYWQVIASDKSTAALAVARQNAKQLQVKNVTFIESNWFSDMPACQFDLIVSNPPYLANQDPHLQQGDLRFEPHSALASGETGLIDLQTIVLQAATFLKPNGILMVEHGYDQEASVQTLFEQAGFAEIKTLRDLQDHPRLTFGSIQN